MQKQQRAFAKKHIYIVSFIFPHKPLYGTAPNTELPITMSETILHLDKHVLLCFDAPADEELIHGK